MSRVYDGSIPNRKGTKLMHRLGGKLPFESAIEERTLWLLDGSPLVRHVERAPSVTVFLPDGKETVYTADFRVHLADGRTLTLECKPAAVLRVLLEQEMGLWRARAEVQGQQGQPLYIVLDTDSSPAAFEQAKQVTPYAKFPVGSEVRQSLEHLLRERGPTPFQELRAYLAATAELDPLGASAALYSLLAQGVLVAETDGRFPDCRLDLWNGALPVAVPPVGRPFAAVVEALAMEQVDVSALPTVPYTVHEQRFLTTERGQRSLKLFSALHRQEGHLSAEKLEALERETGVSRRTIQRFRRKMRDSGAQSLTFTSFAKEILATPQHPRRRIDLQVTAIIERLAEQSYFIHLGYASPKDGIYRARSVNDLFEMVRKECLSAGLTPPVYNTVKAFLEQMAARDPVKATERRYGKEASQKVEARQGHLGITRYGELIGIDCTPADVFTVEGRLMIDLRGRKRPEKAIRAHIVTVVDIATGQVLRSAIYADAIKAAYVLQTLRDIFLGNNDALAQAGMTAFPQAQGLPAAIRMDSGTEFLNRHVERALNGLGVDVVRRNKFSRHHGGMEERTIGSLVHMHHVLPGTTSYDINSRGEYDAQKGAVLDLAQLNRFHQLCVERYNALVAPLQTMTRQEHAAHLLERGQNLWRPVSEDQLQFLQTRMHPQEIRRCRATGVHLHDLQYTSAKLAPLIVQRAQVEVFYDPDDISVAKAADMTTGEIFEIFALLPQGIERPLSLAAWTEVKGRFREARRQALDNVKTPQQIAAETLAVSAEHARRKGKSVIPISEHAVLRGKKLKAVTEVEEAEIEFEVNMPEEASA